MSFLIVRFPFSPPEAYASDPPLQTAHSARSCVLVHRPLIPPSAHHCALVLSASRPFIHASSWPISPPPAAKSMSTQHPCPVFWRRLGAPHTPQPGPQSMRSHSSFLALNYQPHHCPSRAGLLLTPSSSYLPSKHAVHSSSWPSMIGEQVLALTSTECVALRRGSSNWAQELDLSATEWAARASLNR